MTPKQEAALRQAREALKKCDAALAEELAAWDIDPPLHHVQEASNACGPAITAIDEALAEQPAQQALDKMAENARELGIQMQPEEPRAWFTVDELNAWADKKLKENPQWAEQPAQQEPVAWMWRCKPYCGWPEWSVSLKRPADSGRDGHKRTEGYEDVPLYISPQPSKPWVGLTDEDTYEATGTAGTDLLALAKMWSDKKIHVYQFDNEARKIIEAVLRRASAKLREKNTGETK